MATEETKDFKETENKQAAVKPSAEKLKALQLAMDKIEKDYGKGTIMKMGDNHVMDVPVIPTGSIGLNAAFVAGFSDQIVVDGLCPFGDISFEEVEHFPLEAAVLHMIGNGQDIESVVPGLTNTEFGGTVAVGIDRMGMEIGLVDVVSVDLRQNELGPLR